MLLRKTYKYRIYPTRSQIATIENHFSMLRHLYNQCLAERIDLYKSNGKTLSYYQQTKILPPMKIEKPWYNTVYAQCLCDSINRLDKAYQNFFRRVKEGGPPGFPKFKKRGSWNSMTYPQYYKRPQGDKVTVPKIGKVKIIYTRKIPDEANVKTMTISKEGGNKWFACFSTAMEVDVIEADKIDPAIGIDLGLTAFLYSSDGKKVDPPKYLKKKQKELARLQRRLQKTEKRTKAYYTLLRAIQACHYKIRCKRNDYLHKTSNGLLGKANTIVHEKLIVKNMVRRPKPKKDENEKYIPNGASQKAGLNRAINDAGWSRFIEYLDYKAKWGGKKVVGIDPKYTSQICSACGRVVKKSLSVRTHRCECGYVADRDYNAALNILRIGLDALASKRA